MRGVTAQLSSGCSGRAVFGAKKRGKRPLPHGDRSEDKIKICLFVLRVRVRRLGRRWMAVMGRLLA